MKKFVQKRKPVKEFHPREELKPPKRFKKSNLDDEEQEESEFSDSNNESMDEESLSPKSAKPKKPKIAKVISNPNTLKDLMEVVSLSTKSHYRSKLSELGSMIKNVANLGVKPGTFLKMDRQGEYHGLTVQALQEILPLFTHQRVIETINFLINNNIPSAINHLCIQEEVKQFGLEIINFSLKEWLYLNNLPLSPELQRDFSMFPPTNNLPLFEKLLKRIKANRHDPLEGKLKVISIGLSKKGFNVVPEEWINRDFESGEEMHRAMDNLDWRMGKPPVVYCVTYGLMIQEENHWNSFDQVNISILKPGIFLRVSLEKNKIICAIEEFNDSKEIEKWQKSLHQGFKVLVSKDAHLAMELDSFFHPKDQNSFERSEISGILASRLQKCIRRGGLAGGLLEETIRKMRKNPPYNLPELQFLRVNSNRQIFWRLFISCIEDMSPYLKSMESDYLGLNDLVAFTVVTSYDADLQMNDFLLEKVIKTAKLIQSHDKPNDLFDWRSGSDKITNNTLKMNKGEKDPVVDLKNALVLALKTQNMMSGDRSMIVKTLSLMDSSRKSLIYLDEKRLSLKIDSILEKEVSLASYDMHCVPNIILLLQGSLNFFPLEAHYNTQGISSLIWEISSSQNMRNIVKTAKKKTEKDLEILSILREIQDFFYSNELKKGKSFMGISEEVLLHDFKDILAEIIIPNAKLSYVKEHSLTANEKRIAFLNLFGKKIRFTSKLDKGNKNLEGIFCGDDQHPTKIKTLTSNKMVYLNEKPRFLAEIDFIEELSKRNTYFADNPKPPLGYEWIWGDKKKVEIFAELISSDKENMRNSVKTYVEGQEIELFNAEKVLKPMKRIKTIQELPKSLEFLIKKALFHKEIENIEDMGKLKIQGFFLNLLLRSLAIKRFQANDFRIFDVFKLLRTSGIAVPVWKHVLIKLFTSSKEEILIGPVDRQGKKLQNSISSQFEGVIWRIYNLISLLYPRVIKASSDLKFKINHGCSEYLHLYEMMLLLSKEKIIKEIEVSNTVAKVTPQIKTHLWEHQQSTANRIFEGLVKLGKRGFGDASCVGSGKTLTALSIVQKIIEQKNKCLENNNNTYKGILILLPTQNLFETWSIEIKKHTTGFDWIIQESNGKINREPQNIKRNTLIITTLGRFRDHPIYVSWQLVVIDECLSVQNREALQTEEAWKQVIISEFGVIMMSATFFRSRFDKMFFMLKMLRSGLPEEKDFLDCILNESMICYINEKTRKWITNVNRFKLPENLRKGYNEIKGKSIALEKLYRLLENYLYENFSIIDDLKSLLKKLETEKEKVLIYAKSKNEADDFAAKMPNVSRFPDISGRHVAVAYSEGTYGLNNLVKFTCILSRPPEPDKLPQMKGRLDRPGQEKETLRLEYFLIEDTVEEGQIIRIEVANKFLNDYVMPLAKFYEIAVGKSNES